MYLTKICKLSSQNCTFQQTFFPKKSFHLNLHVSFREFFFHKSVLIARKTPAKELQQEWDPSVTVNGWIIPYIFKVLSVSGLEILPYILRIPISGFLYPEDIGQFFRSAQNFDGSFDYTSPWNTDQCYLKFGIETARYPTLLHICQAAQRANSHLVFPSSAVVPNSYLTSYIRLLLGWCCLALPYSKPPGTGVPASSHSGQQGVFGEHLLLVWTLQVSLSASCAIAVPLESAWFRTEAMQTATPEAEVACHFPFHLDMILQSSSLQHLTFLATSVPSTSQQMGKSRMTEILNKGRMVLTLRKQSFPSPHPSCFKTLVNAFSWKFTSLACKISPWMTGFKFVGVRNNWKWI